MLTVEDTETDFTVVDTETDSPETFQSVAGVFEGCALPLPRVKTCRYYPNLAKCSYRALPPHDRFRTPCKELHRHGMDP